MRAKQLDVHTYYDSTLTSCDIRIAEKRTDQIFVHCIDYVQGWICRFLSQGVLPGLSVLARIGGEEHNIKVWTKNSCSVAMYHSHYVPCVAVLVYSWLALC